MHRPRRHKKYNKFLTTYWTISPEPSGDYRWIPSLRRWELLCKIDSMFPRPDCRSWVIVRNRKQALRIAAKYHGVTHVVCFTPNKVKKPQASNRTRHVFGQFREYVLDQTK
jgi:hypothetical protein